MDFNEIFTWVATVVVGLGSTITAYMFMREAERSSKEYEEEFKKKSGAKS